MNGSMRKLIVIPSILSLMMIALVGCEEDNGIYGSGGSNNITLTSFANSYDSQVNATAIARIDESYRTGAREIKIKNLVNNYSNQSLNTLDKTILANNFEGRLENKNIEVNGRTVKRPIYEKNTNNKSSYEVTYKTLDLSGVKADSYLAGNTVSDSRGIITSLNHYPKIPATLAFPAGSVCYIPVVTSERAFLAFNEKDMKVKQKQFFRRIVAATLSFFVVTLVEFVVQIVANTSDYTKCIACAVSDKKYCGPEVERPFDTEYPDQETVFNPDEGFVQPPLDLGQYEDISGGGSNPSNPTNPGDSNEIVAYAKKWVGTAYIWGGETLEVGNPNKGVDCSGFTKKVFEKFGVSLPHSAHSQSSLGTAVNGLSNAQPGDLLFWDWGGDGKIDHVAIYIGDNQKIHASGNQRCEPFTNNGCQVKIDSGSMNKITKIRRVS